MLTPEQISDQLELQQLVTDYANAIDGRDWDRLDRVFTPDARIDYSAMGGIAGSYAEIRAWLPQALKAFPAYMHFIGNLSFQVDGDTATGQVACINPITLPVLGTVYLALWYRDRYRRTPDGWRICERVEHSCHMPRWMRLAAKLQQRKKQGNPD
jgi:ketosteroid isomerase-like protein